jgi:predicted CoA-binding protein
MYEKLAAKIDEIAESLEEKGFVKEAEVLDIISNTLEKDADKKWIQKAVPESREGKFEKWCQGGKPQKMALFAVNVSKGKYTYPD